MSMALTLASKLSPSTLFLFAPSPPKLPQVPTLAELQKQAEGFQQSIHESLPKYSFLSPQSTTEAKSIEDGRSGLGARSGSPPSYSASRTGKLKKASSWRKIQDNIPGEGPKMDSSSVYAQSVKNDRSIQPQIDQLGQGEEGKWWSWMACRG